MLDISQHRHLIKTSKIEEFYDKQFKHHASRFNAVDSSIENLQIV